MATEPSRVQVCGKAQRAFGRLLHDMRCVGWQKNKSPEWRDSVLPSISMSAVPGSSSTHSS